MNKTPSTFRERLASLIGGDPRREEVARLEKFNSLVDDLRDWKRSPAAIVEQLAETDGQLLDLLLRQRNYTPLIGGSGISGVEWSESDRLEAVRDSRYMHHYDVMTARAVKLWTDFGFGQHIAIKPRDEKLAEVWKECWTARRNKPIFGQRKIKKLSTDALVDGEYFLLAYISTIDGEVTFRRFPTEKIAEIVSEKEDTDIPIWYVQNSTSGPVYYRDWQASNEQVRDNPIPPDNADAKDADELKEGTVVRVLHVAFNEYKGRGWPQLTRALDWARAYRNFLQDRASIAASVALYVDKLKVKGNQRALDNIKQGLQSTLVNPGRMERNPPPAAGSTWMENEQVSRERMPMGTGAGDAQTDGMTIAAQFASGSDVPLHFLNRPDAMQNRAVARESGLPWYETIQSYQSDWKDIFKDIVELVGRAANQYGNAGIVDFEAAVLLDSPFESDIAETVSAIGAVTGALAAQSITAPVAERVQERLFVLLLTALGVQEAEAVVVPEEEPDAPPLTDAMEKAIAALRAGRVTGAQFAEFVRLEKAANGNGSGTVH